MNPHEVGRSEDLPEECLAPINVLPKFNVIERRLETPIKGGVPYCPESLHDGTPHFQNPTTMAIP
jgi:hypothetical protein